MWPPASPDSVRCPRTHGQGCGHSGADGLHTGEATIVGADYMGLDIHRAAPIASSAHGGQVVMSDITCALVADALADGVTILDG